jgi:hypothetical protein
MYSLWAQAEEQEQATKKHAFALFDIIIIYA